MRSLGNFGRVSKRLIASYVADWVFIIAIGLITLGLNKIEPTYHPFSLVDLSISYPFKGDLVSTSNLTLAAIVGPAIIILIVSFVCVPGPNASKRVPWGLLLRRKLWEWNTGWLGLGLSAVTTLLITTGLKNAVGKPRPHMLASCQPDTSLESIQRHAIGTYAADYSPYWVLVEHGICQQLDKDTLKDGFRSFPSGHSSTSWSGLLYLSLYLCSKFAVVFPHLPAYLAAPARQAPQSQPYYAQVSRGQSTEAQRPILQTEDNSSTAFEGRRQEAAAPPLYLLFFLFVPIGVALFICASRFYDYRHHGFDIISGSLIGALTSWFSFRMYHMPIERGAGWSWGPRSAGRAFGVGVGSNGYVSLDELPQREHQDDLEMGRLPSDSRGRRDSLPYASLDAHETGLGGTPRNDAGFAPTTLSVPPRAPPNV